MIKIIEEQTELEFGNGDICIAAGHFLNEDNKRVGLVAFINQEPREIGSVGITKANEEHNVDDFPVIMSFSKVESIDVVIEQLQYAKADMLSK